MVPIYSNCSGESLPAVNFPTLDLHWIIGVLEEGGGWFSSMQMLSGHIHGFTQLIHTLIQSPVIT